MNLRHLMRMARWARHPPAMWRVKLGAAVLVICLSIYAIERWIGWPDFLTLPDRPNMRRML